MQHRKCTDMRFYRNYNDESDGDDSSYGSDSEHSSDKDPFGRDSDSDSDSDKQADNTNSSSDGSLYASKSKEDDEFYRSLGPSIPRVMAIESEMALRKAIGEKNWKLFEGQSTDAKRTSSSWSLSQTRPLVTMDHEKYESIGSVWDNDGYIEADPFARTMNPAGNVLFRDVNSLLANRKYRQYDQTTGAKLRALNAAGIFASKNLIRQVAFQFPQVSGEQLRTWAWPTYSAAAMPGFVMPPKGTLYPTDFGRCVAVGSATNDRTQITYWCVYKCPLRYPFVKENTGDASYWNGFHAVPRAWADGSLNPLYQRTLVVTDIDAFNNQITFLNTKGSREIYDLEEMWNLNEQSPNFRAIKLAIKDVVNDYPLQLRPLLGFGRIQLSEFLRQKLAAQAAAESGETAAADNTTTETEGDQAAAPTAPLPANLNPELPANVQASLYGPPRSRKIPIGQRLVDILPRVGPQVGDTGIVVSSAQGRSNPGFNYSAPTTSSPFARGTSL